MNEKTTVVTVPQITHKTFDTVIKPCLKSLTKEQWVKLQASKVDFSTRALFAVLVQDLISVASRIFSKSLKQDVFVSEELIEFTLGDKLFYCFARVLGVENKVPCYYSKLLTHLIGKHVTDTLRNRRITEKSTHTASILPCTIGPFDLYKMVLSVHEVLQRLVARRSFMCKNQQRSPTSNGSVRQTCVQRVIGQEACQLTNPLLNLVPDLEYQVIQRLTVEDTKKATQGIDLSKSAQMGVKKITIQKCFVKGLAKASIHRTLAQLRKEHPTVTKVQSTDKMRRFFTRLDSLLEYGKSFKFREDLSILIFHYLTSRHLEETRTSRLLQHLYTNIRHSLTYFQTLISWWVKTQADLHFKVVMRKIASVMADEKKKEPIKTIVLISLLTLVRKVPKLDFENIRHVYHRQHESIVHRLVDMVLVDVKVSDFLKSKINVVSVLKALCKKCGSEYNVLRGLAQKDSRVEHLFVTCLKDQLQEKKTGAFSRFFSKCKHTFGHCV